MAQEQKPKEPSVTFQVKAGLPQAPQVRDVEVAVGDLRPWDLDNLPRFTQMGQRRPRTEAPLKVTGRARYTYDIKLPGMLYGRMIGAEIPAGEVLSIDTSRAEALPGVKAVWTADVKTIRFAGQDVAAVAAVSPEIAEDAARLVKVAYKEKPFVQELRAAMRPDAPLVYAESESPAGRHLTHKGNVAGPSPVRPGSERGDVTKGLAEADVVLERTYYVPVHTHCTLETHGVVASWEGDQLTVHASTQGIFAVREGLAEALGIDRKNVRVLCEHMGGGFGSKLGPSAAGSAFSVVACKLAKKAGAPVKLMLTRQQEQLSTGNAPSALITVKLGAKRDGTLTAVHYKSYGSGGAGAGAGTAGPASAMYHNNPNYAYEEYEVFTNAGPQAPLRAPGHPQGAFGIESAIDELADAIGMDPLEFRRKNESSPVRASQFDPGAKAIGWERRNKKAGDMTTGNWDKPAPGYGLAASGSGPASPGNGLVGAKKARGIGVANGVWYVLAADDVGAQIKIHRDGSLELFSGCQDIGSGFRTAIGMVAAEELGITAGDITVHVGDTRYPQGLSSGGSMTLNSVAPVVRLAANDARQKLFAIAAPLLGAKPDDLASAKGKIFVAADPTRAIDFKQAAARMPGEVIDCVAHRKRQFDTFRWDLSAVQFAEVEVDLETGEVRVVKMVSVNDCGFPVDPLTTESQVIGAMIQGASWALYENRLLDPNVGTMVNPNLESYKIFTPADMFEAQSILTPVANLGNNTSTAGIGEPPMVPTLAAVANAVHNAIGVRIRELPITPDRVLKALSEASRRA
jgi:xanthine dehydrogenase YagR molybdenum-binding subunit